MKGRTIPLFRLLMYTTRVQAASSSGKLVHVGRYRQPRGNTNSSSTTSSIKASSVDKQSIEVSVWYKLFTSVSVSFVVRHGLGGNNCNLQAIRVMNCDMNLYNINCNSCNFYFLPRYMLGSRRTWGPTLLQRHEKSLYVGWACGYGHVTMPHEGRRHEHFFLGGEGIIIDTFHLREMSCFLLLSNLYPHLPNIVPHAGCASKASRRELERS